MGNDDFDDDLEPEDGDVDNQPEAPLPNRGSTLASRRRIEDLNELRRIRELMGDDEFMLDFE